MKNESSRTISSIKNLRASTAGIFINVIFSFFSRKIFVLVLGKEYVGVSSLIGNITALISLVDFGAATAVTYRLYRALATGDDKSVCGYLHFYRRICALSSVLTCVAGAALSVILPKLVRGFDDAVTLYVVFAASILTSAAEYFFMPERVLLFADQKSYVAQLFSYAFGAVTVVADAVVLVVFKSFSAHLLVHSALSILQDIFVVRHVRRQYAKLGISSKKRYDKAFFKDLVREMVSLAPSNIAGTLSRTVDNFIVVSLFGVSQNGVYSNYNMLLSYAAIFSVTVVGAISASVGNLNASASRARSMRIFGMTSLASFFLVNISTTLLFVMSGDIMTAWLGSTMALPFSCSCALAANFFISGVRRVPVVFRDSLGLYRHEKIKSFVDLFASVALSVFFGKKFGIAGIYLGQAVAAFVVCLWYEPYVLFKYGFGTGVWRYYMRLLSYAAVSAASCLCSLSLCHAVGSFSVKFLVCIAVSAVFFFACFAGCRDLSGIFEKFSAMRAKS
ncbi:MAG: hypothetical protein E7656_03105 [Ruminococcaceae bacterium]|nr:hypothetical protein [Oscillospiraceae bacterium]